MNIISDLESDVNCQTDGSPSICIINSHLHASNSKLETEPEAICNIDSHLHGQIKYFIPTTNQPTTNHLASYIAKSYPVIGYEIFKKDVVIHRENRRSKSYERTCRTENSVKRFSGQSRKRLIFTLMNTPVNFQTYLILTYPDVFPLDGDIIKAHLQAFLERLRRKFKQFEYLWRMEFQERGAIHYNFLLDVEFTEELTQWAEEAWIDIITKWRPDTVNTKYVFEFRKIDNIEGINWYLSKRESNQPAIEFRNLGRFWGCSRGVKPKGKFAEATEEEFRQLLEDIDRPHPDDQILYRVWFNLASKIRANQNEDIHLDKSYGQNDLAFPASEFDSLEFNFTPLTDKVHHLTLTARSPPS